MNSREYYEHNRGLWAVVDAKNKAVDDFVAENPDLNADGVYERFWELQNEATKAIGDVQYFQENNRHQVTR
ncbi:hypothetical protein [Pseudomonas brassicacearum]|uniref:hypothetical protein n=1 Tax=Pseudomonas brassicacearum TaxID=930166 RepID=UPI001BDEE545|nr:hypothetical protein [Pseudomonas brassicacearum]